MAGRVREGKNWAAPITRDRDTKPDATPPPPNLIVLSGPLCAGKTTLAHRLLKALGTDARVVSARAAIRDLSRSPSASRSELQALGKRLDEQSGGTWLADRLRVELNQGAGVLIVDAVRTGAQLAAIIETLAAQITHIHLGAATATRAARFGGRADEIDIGGSFIDAEGPAVETEAEQVRRAAHLVIDTTGVDAAVVFELARRYVAARTRT